MVEMQMTSLEYQRRQRERKWLRKADDDSSLAEGAFIGELSRGTDRLFSRTAATIRR